MKKTFYYLCGFNYNLEGNKLLLSYNYSKIFQVNIKPFFIQKALV